MKPRPVIKETLTSVLIYTLSAYGWFAVFRNIKLNTRQILPPTIQEVIVGSLTGQTLWFFWSWQKHEMGPGVNNLVPATYNGHLMRISRRFGFQGKILTNMKVEICQQRKFAKIGLFLEGCQIWTKWSGDQILSSSNCRFMPNVYFTQLGLK